MPDMSNSEIVWNERELMKRAELGVRLTVTVKPDWRVRWGWRVALAGLKVGSWMAGITLRAEVE